ncbi:Adenylate cyclase [Diplonema papillatum]|nr:Adenylate cyclase [Diplonema papillatum]
MFRIGNAAVLFGWSQDTEELMDVQGNASAGAENWTFSAGPIPGNGSGCAGDWSIVVNRHTTNAPAAIHFLQFYLSEVVPRVGLSGVGHEPILNSLMPNGTAWGTYCATNPILCESYERYPEFWDRLTYRPSLGCKNKYSACLASIGEAIRAYFTSSWSPENAVAAMEVDLKRVLGYTNHQDAVSQFDWTWSRILVFVTVALAMANFAFFASRYWQLWSVRQNIRDVARTRRTVPMAVAFGLIILVFLGFVACALIYIQTTSTTDFANRLGATKRKQALLELNRFVVDSLVKFKNEQLSAESNIMRTVASAKNAIGRVDFESASLVLMIDRDLGTVLASSNLREQPDDVSFTTDGNGTGPWLAAAIKGYPAWNRTTLDPEEYLTTRAGETLYVSMSEVTKYLSHTTTVRWLLLYFAPRAVVLEESSKVFAQALDISIILTVASVCIALALAYAITSPLAKLANDIDTVSAMNFDALRRSMKTKSYFTESTVLLNGFKKMAQILKEYKSFIPRVLFVDKPPNSRGNAAVVCTEVQNSAKIWLWNSAVMRAAKEVYNDCVKCCFNTTGGFEASAFGDSFMICFNYLDDASAFAVTVQEALYRENSWPVLLNDCEYARVSEGWNGLRVKVGLCWGPVDVQVTSVSGKSEYCGPTVIRANQICKACSGGAVAMTSEGFCAVSWKDIGAGIFVVAEYNVTFSETSDSFDLHLLVPGSLQVRAEAVRLQFEEANRLTIQGSNPLTTVSPYPHSQTESSPRKSLDLSQNTPSGVQPTPSPPVRRKISASALTKPASCVSSAAGTSRPDSVVPRNLKQRLFVKVCTVGHLCADLSLLNNARDALADVNEYLSRVSTAVDRTSGALVSLSSNNSVIAWNGIKENQSHVASAIRFATLLHKSSSSNNSFMCADNLQFGLAVGTGLAGNVRAADQKFVMLIGTAVEVAEALARAARAQYIYCLAAALPGHDSLSQEKAASGRIRPIDTWLLSDARGGDDVGVAVGEDDTDAESMSMSNSSKSTITVYELDTKADTNVTFQHVNPPWGWSNLYAIAFHCRNWKEIEANTKNDRVLRKVVQRLREETARPLVFCSYDAPADPLGTRGLR